MVEQKGFIEHSFIIFYNYMDLFSSVFSIVRDFSDKDR